MTTRRLAKVQNKREQEMTLKPNLGLKAIPTAQITEINVQIPGLVNPFGMQPSFAQRGPTLGFGGTAFSK